jgi:hypothetical protein
MNKEIEKCKHDLIALTNPAIGGAVSSLAGGAIYHYPPYFKCTKCKQIFTVGNNKAELFKKVMFVEE